MLSAISYSHTLGGLSPIDSYSCLSISVSNHSLSSGYIPKLVGLLTVVIHMLETLLLYRWVQSIEMPSVF